MNGKSGRSGSSADWRQPGGLGAALRHRLIAAAVVAGVAAVLGAFTGAAQAQAPKSGAVEKGPSGLPLPRFVSLKAEPVNLRRGPGTQYPIAWVLRRAGMPLEIVREYENWRQVRDADGTTGWVVGTFLSGRRTAVVAPWTVKKGQPRKILDLHKAASATSGLVARLEAGNIVDIAECNQSWCNVWAGKLNGYIRQKELWGVYPNETIE